MNPSANAPALPRIVSPEEWQMAHENFLAKEKAATRARDALAAERRRLPMVKMEQAYVFQGPQGAVPFLDLFEGRWQLLLYHFMFAPEVNGWPDAGCPGCSMFTDQVGNLTHLYQRDTSFALVSLGPWENLERYRKRMGWQMPWYSSAGGSFNADLGISTEEGESHGLSVFLRDDASNIYRTYFTSQRDIETVASIWTLLDLTPYGRQEFWEDSPTGWPQSEPFQWWRRHDQYETKS